MFVRIYHKMLISLCCGCTTSHTRVVSCDGDDFFDFFFCQWWRFLLRSLAKGLFFTKTLKYWDLGVQLSTVLRHFLFHPRHFFALSPPTDFIQRQFKGTVVARHGWVITAHCSMWMYSLNYPLNSKLVYRISVVSKIGLLSTTKHIRAPFTNTVWL